MNILNAVPAIKLNALVQQESSLATQKALDNAAFPSFGETMSNYISEVNQDQSSAAKLVSDVIQGRSENVHGAMISMSEAKISFQLMLEIRNRMLDAYKEIERMQM